MTIHYNPRIVTDGLVLCLDGANAKSYPGSGTTCTDISGNGNNGTFLGSTSYSTDNLGKFVFNNDTNDRITCGNDSSINFGTGSFSYSLWFRRFSNATTNLRLISKGADNNDPSFAGFASWGGNNFVSFVINPSGERIGTGNITFNLNEWVNLHCVFLRGDSLKIFKNGSLVDTTPTTTTGSLSSTKSLYICGAGTNGDALNWPGEVAIVLLYNRALSQDEVSQNFNATRGRFGV